MNAATSTLYRNGTAVGRFPLDASMPPEGQAAFIWIELFQPLESELSVLQERFHLHKLTVDHAMAPEHLPKLDLYDDQTFAVLKIARLQGDEISYSNIDAFVSTHHIITVRHSDGIDYAQAREKVERGPKSSRLGPDFILHALVEFAVNSYIPVVQMVEDDVLAMEHRVLDAFLSREEVTRLFRLRREVIHFQHVLAGMTDVCGKLGFLDIHCIGAPVKPYFRDAHNRVLRVNAMISGLVDVIRAVFEASNLLEQQRQGVTTRQLAGWAAILAVPTAIAGLYGMNFPNMPGIDTSYGYAVVVALTLSICVGLYMRFKRLRWL